MPKPQVKLPTPSQLTWGEDEALCSKVAGGRNSAGVMRESAIVLQVQRAVDLFMIQRCWIKTWGGKFVKAGMRRGKCASWPWSNNDNLIDLRDYDKREYVFQDHQFQNTCLAFSRPIVVGLLYSVDIPPPPKSHPTVHKWNFASQQSEAVNGTILSTYTL